MTNDIKLSEMQLPEGITKDQLKKIEEQMPELHRAKKIIGHSTSQTSYALQTLTMKDDSPMSRMKQCISQIEHKYQAVVEALFNIEKHRVNIKECFKNENPEASPEMANVLMREAESQIDAINNGVINSLRQIGMFFNYYEAIRKSHNIPVDWNEKDYEKQEIANLIRKLFRIGIQDLAVSNRVSKAFVEFSEQLGIHPQVAAAHCKNYCGQVDKQIAKGKAPPVEVMYKFLDDMAERFKDCYKSVLKRIGLKELGSEEFRI